MSIRESLVAVTRAARGVTRIFARSLRRADGRGGVVIQPYRGYGTRREVFLMGRVLRQPRSRSETGDAKIAHDIIDVVKLLLRRGVPRAVVAARFAGVEQRVETDCDGYFRVHMRLVEPPPPERLWHEMDLELSDPIGVRAKGIFYVPPVEADFAVVSDIDDTVVRTGVGNKLAMIWRLYREGMRSRVAFPGLAAFYNALHRGPSCSASNPMLYVSRASWSLYEVLNDFFHVHRIPIGPILFLREWGVSFWRPWPRRGRGHKLALVGTMVALYRDLPFVLIGDSGERDPEIYAEIVRRHPGRVRAIYIRNVTQDPRRRRAIESLAKEVAEAGSSLVLATDSFAMAEHAVAHDLVSAEALAEIMQERAEGEVEEPRHGRLHLVAGPTPGMTRNAIEDGELERLLEAKEEVGVPPNVIVEPRRKRAR